MRPVSRYRRLLAVAALLLGTLGLAAVAIRPSNQRAWISGQARLPHAQIRGDSLTLRNVRDFRYAADGAPATERYQDRSYDLSRIETVWFIIAPFDTIRRGAAHAFLSFGFTDSQFVAISVEARKEVGEEYSLLAGLFRRFELMYVVGDERDLIGLRVARRDEVYVYPIKTTPAKVRTLFVGMLERANQLEREPEFYNTLLNNCTTNILEHANRVATNKIPYGSEVLLPGNADALALRLGLIDSGADIAEVRRRFLVNSHARRYDGAPDFSLRIRRPIP